MLKKLLVITMPDDSKWSVPVEIIARNRAAVYADEFDGDIEKSLAEDTVPHFESDDYNVEDWAANNMNWSEVEAHAKLVEQGGCDFQEGWINGDKEVVESA